jgi:hypothetical protein
MSDSDPNHWIGTTTTSSFLYQLEYLSTSIVWKKSQIVCLLFSPLNKLLFFSLFSPQIREIRNHLPAYILLITLIMEKQTNDWVKNLNNCRREARRCARENRSARSLLWVVFSQACRRWGGKEFIGSAGGGGGGSCQCGMEVRDLECWPSGVVCASNSQRQKVHHLCRL